MENNLELGLDLGLGLEDGYSNEINSILSGTGSDELSGYGATPSNITVGDNVGAGQGSVAAVSSYVDQGSAILSAMPKDTMDARAEASLNTKWLKTVLEKEPIKDAETGAIIDEDKIPKKAIGFRMLINGTEQLMTKDQLQAFVAANTLGELGDPSKGDAILSLTARFSKKKTAGIASAKPPIFSFRAAAKEHTLTKRNEQWDCVEFAKEPVVENGEYKREKVPGILKAEKEAPDFTPRQYIVYEWKPEYEPIFATKKSSSAKGSSTPNKALKILLAYTAKESAQIL